MRHFGLDEFKEVLQPSEGPAVTLLMPTLAGGTHFRQNSVRFKNQIRAAEEALSDRGLSAARIKELMAPATEMLGDTPFWEKQSRGLVMFLAPGFSRHYRVPLTLPEMAVVLDGSFHVKPLVPLVAETGRFFLLTLSQNQVSFYEAFRDGMTEIEPIGLPPSLREFLEQKGGEGRRKLQTRSMGTTDRSGGGMAMTRPTRTRNAWPSTSGRLRTPFGRSCARNGFPCCWPASSTSIPSTARPTVILISSSRGYTATSRA